MIDHLSSSQINLYLLCGLKYRFQYLDKLPRTFRPSALAFGSAVHSALSWFHKERMRGNGTTLDQLMKIFDADWFSQKVETNIRYKDGEEEMKLTVQGKEMLALYYRRPHKKFKGTEVPFTVPLVNLSTGEELGMNFEGFFDLVEADDTIVEFKTSAQALSPNDIHAHLQLTAYGYAFEFLHGKPPQGFKLINFIKGKKTRLVVTETTRKRAHYEGFFFLAQQVLNGIRNGAFVPRTGYWCKECEYAGICPMWRGNGADGAISAVEAEGGAGHDRAR